MAKKRYVRNGIVFDPNIELDMFDYDYEETMKAKKKYTAPGSHRRKLYKGL
jgi:hypothetical protein